MKKLKLNLDEIKVESFIVSESPQTKGTVNGQNLPCDSLDPCGSGGGGGGGGGGTFIHTCAMPGGGPCYTEFPTCLYYNTCGATCDMTCPATCQISCYGSCYNC